MAHATEETLKVFISWSGKRSRDIAEILRQWMPSVLQAVKPYYSPDDVSKGSRWASEISKELEGSHAGLLVVTPENQDAPWLNFEAGALAKNLDRSRVCPLLFGGMQPTDVKGPLVQFQSAHFSKDEMKRVMKMLNTSLSEAALASEVLEKVFEMWWPSLEEQISRVPEDKVDQVVQRSERDMLEEVLARVRDFRMVNHQVQHGRIGYAVDEMTLNCVRLIDVLKTRQDKQTLYDALKGLIKPLLFFGKYTRGTSLETRSLLQNEWKRAQKEFEPRLPAPEPEAIEVEPSLD